jgi:phosphoribosylamine--glycine ligase
MNILLIGSGGREHALAWKINQSPLCSRLFIAPGNPGTDSIAQRLTVKTDDFEGIAAACKDNKIDLLVVGPEVPLVAGLRDYLEKKPGFESLKAFHASPPYPYSSSAILYCH